MVAIRFASAIAAASMLLSVSANTTPSATVSNHIETPSVTLPASAISEIGCFETGVPLENHGDYLFRSPGNCQLICIEQGKPVMGLSDGVNCWCGDLIPPKDSIVPNATCDTTCSGDKTVKCGGPGVLWVALTGTTRNRVDNYVPDDSSSSSSSSTSTSTSSAPTASKSAPPPPPEDGGNTNTVAIAVGVVVGVIGLAGILFGVWFFLRKRRQRQAEEDYRRNAANVSSFVNGGKLQTSNSSMNDSRLDPSFMDRRQSNGSIADNEDYSRRILKVTNV
ncbi:Protein SLG1 [Coniothyrium glycines]